MNVLGILAFFAALLISVTLHEAGHFLTARRYGMKATQFFVGFGPTLWSRRKGETEYGVKAVPLGGFVKIVGMTPLEEVEPGDEGRAFFRHKPWPKFVVLVAGSTMHFVLALVLTFAGILAIGVVNEDTTALSAPSDCLPLSVTAADVKAKKLPATDLVDGACPTGTVPGLAKAAGLQPGDRVVSVNGLAITSYKGLTKVVRASAGEKLTMVVQRGDARTTVTVTPREVTRYDLATRSHDERVGAIGISNDPTVLDHKGFFAAFPETGRQVGLMVSRTWETLTEKIGTVTGIYGDDRDPEGFVGLVGAGRITGEVASADIPFSYKALGFLGIVASLNLFVGVFNLLPLLPLDGGHIAVVWFEAVRDRIKRARGYVGEVVRVDYNKLMPVTAAVVALFIGFTVWILGADIVNPIKIGG